MPTGIYKRTKYHRKILREGWKNSKHGCNCLCVFCRAKYSNNFIPWNKGLTKENNESVMRISIAMKHRKISDKTKEKTSKALTGRKRPEEVKQKIKKNNAKYWLGKKRPGLGEKLSKKAGRKVTDEKKLKNIRSIWTDDLRRWRMEKTKEQFKDGMPQETKNKIRQKSITMWNNPIKKEFIIKKTMDALERRPTKLEQSFIDFFNKHNLPFRYVGDGKLIIGGKIPDFVETNGKKIVLEVGNKQEKTWRFGAWKKYELERIKHFEQNGWKCIVLWDIELQSKEQLSNKIKEILK